MTRYVNIDIIQKYVADNNLSMSAFCKLCNISITTFYKIMLNQNVMTSSLYKVARAMGIRFCEIFCS